MRTTRPRALCDSVCISVASDNANCGACGNACVAGEVCDGTGTCATSCAASAIVCGGACVDPSTDRRFCGASGDCTGDESGSACADGEVCESGACTLVCPPGFAECEAACVDTDLDPDHCGACGVACDAGERCEAGSCTAPGCPPDQTMCGGSCVDTDRDPDHCGACDNACDAGFACDGTGACALSCATGMEICAGMCVDTDRDPDHCGPCDNACDAGFACDGTGACALSCATGMEVCAGMCVDTDRDPDHCGACDNACDAGFACDGTGACALSCATGMEVCAGMCVDTDRDPDHCGACDNACADGFARDGTGACTPSCGDRLEACGGTCVDTRHDPAHCGACDAACASGEACLSGLCRPTRGAVWEASRFPLAAASGGFGDLAFLPSGDILVASTDRTVRRVSFADGTASTYASGFAQYTLGVTHRPADDLVYVSDSVGTIYSVTATGVVSPLVTATARVHSLSIAPAGFGAHGGKVIATLRNGRVDVLEAGALTNIGTLSGANFSDGVFVGATHYLIDNVGGRVVSMTSAGSFATIQMGLSGPDGIMANPPGDTLFVTEGSASRLVSIPIGGGTPTTLATPPINFGDNVTGMLHDSATTLIYRTSSGGLEALTP